MIKMIKELQKSNWFKYLPVILSIGVVIIYLSLGVSYIHHIQPVMDEGTYLLKGKWFLDGTYTPFQDYGPITNKPPLSFISIGISQLILRPGLESGRLLAVFYSVIMLAGLWLTVYKLRGKWWALFSVTLFIISPAWIIYYSRAMTQVVSSMLVAWSLYFLLGDKRWNWDLYLGVILAALTTMIRQNMLPYFALVILFVLWKEGIRKGWKPVLAGILVFLIATIVYWPRIYINLYESHLPDFINNIFNHFFQIDQLSEVAVYKEFQFIDEIQVLFDGIRFFFLPFLAAIGMIFTGVQKSKSSVKMHQELRFLAAIFIFITGVHFIASVNENIFLYSFPAYIAFYLPVGIILIPDMISLIQSQGSRVSAILLGGSAILISAGIGLGIREKIAPVLLQLRVPSSTSIFHGEYELWDVLLARFGIPVSVQNYLLPALAGMLLGLLILAISGVVWCILKKTGKPKKYFLILFFVLFSLGVVFSPTFILAGEGSIETCTSDVLDRNRMIGEKLNSILSPGANIYWEGNIPIPLLYLSDFKMHPAQLNMQFNYLSGGDADLVEKNGYWNDELAKRWINEADYLLLSPEAADFRGIQSDEHRNEFSLLDTSKSLNPCNESTLLLVFKRKG